jgi:dihydrofolate reductase
MLGGMKITLWATLTANGNYARSTPAHPPKREALEDFAAQVRAHGNFIVGRQTFQEFQAQPARSASDAGPTFAAAEIVVVSTSLRIPGGPTCVATPEAAVAHLRERGHTTALVSGGERLHNAFLAANLVDELIVNIAPTMEDDGLRIVLPKGGHRDVTLLGTKELGGGVVQLRYALPRG